MSMKKEKIKLNSVVARPKELPTADVCGEIVMMHLDKGKYFALNPVGSRIWELIEKPQVVEDIITGLLAEYEVDAQTCQDEALEFMNNLYNEDLLDLIE